jgi:hypothetical protein
MVVATIQNAWFVCRTLLCSHVWDSLSDLQKKDYTARIKPHFNIQQPNDLFNPSRMGLQGSGVELPSDKWFRLVEQFYKAFGIGISYTHYGDAK